MSDNNTISEQLAKVASDVLTEDVLKEIENTFNESVNEKAENMANLRVEKALIEQDEEHAVKLEKLLEAIDTDHTNKLKRIVESLDKIHAKKLVNVVEKFKGELDTDAKVFKESLVDNISNYLDLYVEKHIPVDDIQEAVKNKHAVNILAGLKKSLGVDSVMANESVREAVIDGKKQIDRANEKVEQLAEQNRILSENVQKQKATLMLDTLTEGLPNIKKRHMYKMFEGKSSEFINENFEYTLKMFEKTESEKINDLKTEATRSKKLTDRPVTEKKQTVSESVEQQIQQSEPDGLQDRGLFDNYMGELTRW